MFSLKVLGALGTETTRPSSAAQCVAYIGVIELTVGQWQNVIPILVNNLTQAAAPGGAPSSELLKEASLEAIGYICADIVSISVYSFLHVFKPATRKLNHKMMTIICYS